MIIDKILARGEYQEGNKDDTSFVIYRLNFDFQLRIISIHIHTAYIDNFEGSTIEEKAAVQQRYYKHFSDKLMSELEIFFSNRAISSELVFIDPNNYTINIAPQGFNHIKKFVEDNDQKRLANLGCEELPQAVSRIYELYVAASPIYRVPADVFNNIGCLDKSADDDVTDKSAKSGEESDASDSDESKDSDGSEKSVESEVSDTDDDDESIYKAAAKSLATGSPSRFASTYESFTEVDLVDLIIDNENVSAAAQKCTNPRNYKDKSKVILNQLQDKVYDPISRICVAGVLPYEQKQFHINQIKTLIGPLNDIEILSDLYHFINYEPNKRVLNIHKNTIHDMVFFKKNTNTWQELIEIIRKQAFKVLLNNLGMGDNIINNILNHGTTSINGNSPITIPNPQKIIDTLTPYLEDKLFCEHRSNNFFRNNFHATTAVKNLRNVISVCETQIKREKQPIFA